MKEKLNKEVDIDLIEVSAKKGIDVDKVFDILVEKILGNMTTEQILKKYGRSWTESSFSSHVARKKKKCCWMVDDLIKSYMFTFYNNISSEQQTFINKLKYLK